jgi:hypothetical protein
MARNLWTAAAAVFLFLPGHLPSAEPSAPTRLLPTEVELKQCLRTDWYGIYLHVEQAGLAKEAMKLGYAKETLERIAKPGKPGYHSKLELVAKTAANGVKNELRFTEEFEYDDRPPYALRWARSTQTDGKSTREVRITRTDKGFDVVTCSAGEERKKQIGPLDYTLADSITPELWLRRGARINDEVVTRTLDLDELRIDKEIRKLRRTTTSLTNGVKVVYHEVDFSAPREKLTGLERYDHQGHILSGTLGGVFEDRLEPEKQAKDIRQSTDLFVLGTVKVDKSLGDPGDVSELILEVGGKEAAVLKSGPRQTVTPTGSGKYLCKLGKAHGNPVKATAAEIEEALAETSSHLTTHPKIQALLKEALGEARTPRDKVDRLVQFVGKYIRPDYHAEPMTLLDLLKVRRGDCKHYALLLTTLARAAGIPAREVHGLLYMGDDQKAFGGHAWTEVVLDGFWVPVDAAWKETDVNATHLCTGSGLGDDLGWLSTFGKLSFKVLNVKHRE